MKFTKIDENTIRCTISKSEMDAYDVELEDFIKRNKKVKDFVELLIDKAVDEVGYKHEHGMMQLQLQPLPKMGLAITFSNKEITPEELSQEVAAKMGEDMADAFLDMMENLSDAERQQKMKEVITSLEQKGRELEAELETQPETKSPTLEEHQIENAVEPQEERKTKIVEEDVQQIAKNIPNLYICSFENLTDIGAFCRQIPERFFVKGSVYKKENEQGFYMILDKGRCKMEKYLYVCRMAMEFSKMESCSIARFAYIDEQCECIAREKAITIFRKIYAA